MPSVPVPLVILLTEMVARCRLLKLKGTYTHPEFNKNIHLTIPCLTHLSPDALVAGLKLNKIEIKCESHPHPTLSLSEAGTGRFGRQVSVTDIYHTVTIPYHTRPKTGISHPHPAHNRLFSPAPRAKSGPPGECTDPSTISCAWHSAAHGHWCPFTDFYHTIPYHTIPPYIPYIPYHTE